MDCEICRSRLSTRFYRSTLPARFDAAIECVENSAENTGRLPNLPDLVEPIDCLPDLPGLQCLIHLMKLDCLLNMPEADDCLKYLETS